ncbi:MAG: hypothetical protein ACREDK_04335 [Thermoplasmata archaeon]
MSLARQRAAAGPALPVGRAAGTLLQGAIYLADLDFATVQGPVSVAPRDLAKVREYLALAIPRIADYCRQYGATALALGPTLARRSVTVPSDGYTDADLQGWVGAMAGAVSLPIGSSILVLNPPGVVNQDAKESGGVGVLGYHGSASIPYSFVNLLGTGFTVDDRADLFAEAVSHEIAEMTVDPRADGSNPEVCDGCGTNCQGRSAYRSYFDARGSYLGSSTAFPPSFAFAFFLSAIAQPGVASDCPAPANGCAYAPPPV